MAFIEIKNLNKIYGKGEVEVKALNNINLEINEGEFVAIVGGIRIRKKYTFTFTRGSR